MKRFVCFLGILIPVLCHGFGFDSSNPTLTGATINGNLGVTGTITGAILAISGNSTFGGTSAFTGLASFSGIRCSSMSVRSTSVMPQSEYIVEVSSPNGANMFRINGQGNQYWGIPLFMSSYTTITGLLELAGGLYSSGDLKMNTGKIIYTSLSGVQIGGSSDFGLRYLAGYGQLWCTEGNGLGIMATNGVYLSTVSYPANYLVQANGQGVYIRPGGSSVSMYVSTYNQAGGVDVPGSGIFRNLTSTGPGVGKIEGVDVQAKWVNATDSCTVGGASVFYGVPLVSNVNGEYTKTYDTYNAGAIWFKLGSAYKWQIGERVNTGNSFSIYDNVNSYARLYMSTSPAETYIDASTNHTSTISATSGYDAAGSGMFRNLTSTGPGVGRFDAVDVQTKWVNATDSCTVGGVFTAAGLVKISSSIVMTGAAADIGKVLCIRFLDGSISTTAANISGGDMTSTTYDPIIAAKLAASSGTTMSEVFKTSSTEIERRLVASLPASSGTVVFSCFLPISSGTTMSEVFKTTSSEIERRIDTKLPASSGTVVFSCFLPISSGTTMSEVFKTTSSEIERRIDTKLPASSGTTITDLLAVQVATRLPASSGTTICETFLNISSGTEALRLFNDRLPASSGTTACDLIKLRTRIDGTDAFTGPVTMNSSATISGQLLVKFSTSASAGSTEFYGQEVCSNGQQLLTQNQTTTIYTGGSAIKSFTFTPVGDFYTNIHIDSFTGGNVVLHNTSVTDDVNIFWRAIVTP